MTKRRTAFGIGIVAILLLCALAYRAVSNQVNLVGMLARGSEANITVPEGFKVEVFAEGLASPRFIHFGPQGKLYVAERGADRIVSLEDQDGDGRSDALQVFEDNVPDPHSVIYREGDWYVGVPSGVIRLTDQDNDGRADARTVLIDDYPTSGHNTRTVEFLEDGRMVVSVGSSCNVCEEEDPRRAAVVAYLESDEELFATGLRNAVGLTVHPHTGELWATNNGRDLMGDDLPPETVYRLEEGADYGWPRCHSGRIPDPEFGAGDACQGVAAPVVEMQAHSAPLGLVFYDGAAFPEAYRGDLFIAFHGSWNRSVPTGYKVVRLHFEGNEPGSQVIDFASGWLEEDLKSVTGRPVGLAVGPDGALYVSDDSGGFIYRIAYIGGQQLASEPSATGQDEQDLATRGSPEEAGVAEVQSVNATGEARAFTFAVQVASPDTGCDQYADWWEVVSEEGELLYRRTLLHSHVSEQPFTRTGGPVPIDADTEVVVRAHMYPNGYGGTAMRGSISSGFEPWEPPANYAEALESAPPQPPDCGF